MRQLRFSAYFGPLLLLMFLLPSPTALPAQTQPAGASVAVRMIEAIDSGKDPAGKQYRALVTKAVDAGNGVTIPQGAAAAVTLVNNGNGSSWTTHLVSVTLNGQPVAVTSGPASMAGGLQSTASNAVNAVGSVLGGFGHHVKPTSVTAVATGQRVVLPPGVTLTFVLSQPPASNPATPAAAAPAPPLTASAASAVNPESSSASSPAAAAPPTAAAGENYAYCYAGDSETVTYFSEVFAIPALQGNPPPHMAVVTQQRSLTSSWTLFLEKKHAPSELVRGNCLIADLHASQMAKQHLEAQFKQEKKQIVETGWKYTPGTATATATAPTTATTAYYAQCAAILGERANENCAAAANEYYVYCYSASLDGPVMYFSDVFAFNTMVSTAGNSISSVLAGPYLQFLETKFGVKVNSDFYSTSQYTGGSYPTYCSKSLTPLSSAQEQKQLTEGNVAKTLHKQIVETGWKTSIMPLPPVTAPPAAANEHYVSCYSDSALNTQYFSAIFAAAPSVDPIRAAFLAFLQKKYGFSDTRPGLPVDCEVSPKPGDAYMFKNVWSFRQFKEGLANVTKNKVVETGWKYTP